MDLDWIKCSWRESEATCQLRHHVIRSSSTMSMGITEGDEDFQNALKNLELWSMVERGHPKSRQS